MDSKEEYKETSQMISNVFIPIVLPKTEKGVIVNETELLKSLEQLNEVEIRSTRKGVFRQILLTSAILLTAAACGMPIGYSTVILPQLYNSTDPLAMTIEMGSWIASVHSLATPFGSFVSGPIMDRWGRRPALLMAIVPLFTGWIILATASSHFLLLVGRVVSGIAVGVTAAPAQILIAETAEPHLRGMLIGAPFISYSLGILLVYALGAFFHWRIVAWGGTVLPVISFIALFLAYESPTWLARNGQMSKAAESLNWLRGGDVYAKKELQQLTQRIEIEKALQEANNNKTESFFKLMGQAGVLKPMIIINCFHMLLILSGTYLVVFYAVDIISEFGGESMDMMKAAVLTAVVRLVFTVIYCYLMHAIPRRSMVIGSGIGSGLSSIVLSTFMYLRLGQPKTSLDLYFAGFCILVYLGSNTGFMAMPGCMVGELLPSRIRGRYAGYIFAVFNFSLFGVAKAFPFLQYTLKTRGLFMLFGLASLAIVILFYFLLPETKGKSLSEIEDYFSGKNWVWSKRDKTMEHNKKEKNKMDA